MRNVFFIGSMACSLQDELMELVSEIERSKEGSFLAIDVAVGPPDNFINSRFFFSKNAGDIERIPHGINYYNSVVVIGEEEEFLEKFPFLNEATKDNYFFVKSQLKGPYWMLVYRDQEPEQFLTTLFP